MLVVYINVCIGGENRVDTRGHAFQNVVGIKNAKMRPYLLR